MVNRTVMAAKIPMNFQDHHLDLDALYPWPPFEDPCRHHTTRSPTSVSLPLLVHLTATYGLNVLPAQCPNWDSNLWSF